MSDAKRRFENFGYEQNCGTKMLVTKVLGLKKKYAKKKLGYEHKSGYEKTMQKQIGYENKCGTKILVTKKCGYESFG